MAERKITVDTYITASATFAQPILQHLRDLVHGSCPEMRESIKWSMPFFLCGETILCNMAAFRAHCSFGFWDRRMTPILDEFGVLSGAAMGSLGRIRSVDDLPDDVTMSTLLAHARELAHQGQPRVPLLGRSRKPELTPPADLLQALSERTGAADRFNAMSPSCRREYVEWILEAKREETRTRRVAEATARIAEGRSHNEMYKSERR